MKKLGKAGSVLMLTAITQMVAGVLVTSGCLCGPDFRMVGFAVSFGMAAVVVAFGGLAVLARRFPRVATLSAVGVEALLVLFLMQRQIATPLIAWYAQSAASLLICIATVLAFRCAHSDGASC